MEHISQTAAASKLGVTRPTLNYYMRVLNIKPVKFELDKRKYLRMEDFEAIREMRSKALERQGREAKEETLV